MFYSSLLILVGCSPPERQPIGQCACAPSMVSATHHTADSPFVACITHHSAPASPMIIHDLDLGIYMSHKHSLADGHLA